MRWWSFFLSLASRPILIFFFLPENYDARTRLGTEEPIKGIIKPNITFFGGIFIGRKQRSSYRIHEQ